MLKKFSHILAFLGLNIALLTMFQIPAFAQSTITRPPIIPAQNQEIKLPHQTGETSQDNFLINQFLPSIAATIISITGGLALVFVVFNGIRMIASGGDPEQFGKAKQGLIWALAGVVIAGLSFAIVAIISSIRI